jgi:hypothetical protein
MQRSTFNSTGIRAKEDRTRMENLTPQVINISCDIEDLIALKLSSMFQVDRVESYIEDIKIVRRDFRRVHAQIKQILGNEHATQYPDYDKIIKDLDDRTDEAWTRLGEVRKNLSDEAFKVQNDQQRTQLLSNRTILVDQINWDIKGCDLEKMFTADEVHQKLSDFRTQLEKFQSHCSDLEVCFRDEDHGFNDSNTELIQKLRDLLTQGQKKLFLIEEARRNSEAQKNQHLENLEAERVAKENELILGCATGLQKELDLRSKALLKKLVVDFSALDDFEILELKKQEENLHAELRELIDKVSEFKKFVLPCGNAAESLNKQVTDASNKCTKALDSFDLEISKIVSARDISEKKLANSAGLKMDFDKFSGYDSSMDIYTFKTKFQKLVQPYVQKHLWGEYMKAECLSGAALSLVSKMEDSSMMWKKLVEVYGDPNLLLQKKYFP